MVTQCFFQNTSVLIINNQHPVTASYSWGTCLQVHLHSFYLRSARFFFSRQSLAVSFFPAVIFFVGGIDDVRENNRSVNRLCFFLSEINVGHSLPKQAYAKIRKSEILITQVFRISLSTFQFQKTVEKSSIQAVYLLYFIFIKFFS